MSDYFYSAERVWDQQRFRALERATRISPMTNGERAEREFLRELPSQIATLAFLVDILCKKLKVPKEYEEGYVACFLYKSKNSNPYGNDDEDKKREWSRGFACAEEDKKVVAP